MSTLRIIGLIIGVLGLFLTFKIYRGPRWKRGNFVFFGLFSLSLLIVSINPNALNTVAEILKLEQRQRGRILALLIGSNILLWFLILYFKNRLDEQKYQFDLLLRNLGHAESKQALEEYLKGKEIVVIIPSYNEAENLKELLPKMPQHIHGKKIGVLVIDDGSTDDTGNVVEKTGYMSVRNIINRGQGGASRLGYDILLHYNMEIGITMDADGQHSPDEIEILSAPILENKCDLVIGSRVLGKSTQNTLLRNLGISLLTKIINMLLGLKLTDCSSGFKAFNMDKMKKLRLTEDQFQSAEVIIEAAKAGLRIKEVPITIMKRKYGKSKKGKDWKYGLLFAKTILKSWWR
ncbi:MAG: glycosyltransferase family 2 protein [Candidatus Ratteibacteria bacterium]|nr:glycosyltransferase family 2 protein [Candidatus Ratteibacteria bacterium]